MGWERKLVMASGQIKPVTIKLGADWYYRLSYESVTIQPNPGELPEELHLVQ